MGCCCRWAWRCDQDHSDRPVALKRKSRHPDEPEGGLGDVRWGKLRSDAPDFDHTVLGQVFVVELVGRSDVSGLKIDGLLGLTGQ